MLRNQCHHNNFILWPLSNPVINYQFKIILCVFSQNDNFRLNKMLHGDLQFVFVYGCFKIGS